MADLEAGLYELLVTRDLRDTLDGLSDVLVARDRGLSGADAADRIAWHVSKQIERALLDVSEEERVDVAFRVAEAVLDRLGDFATVDGSAHLAEPASVLHAILRRRQDGAVEELGPPVIPLLDTTLLTNAPGEPTLWSQLGSEIASAESIDVVMAFIRRSGITPLLDGLRKHCARGRRLRVLTTTYTDSTEREALELLTDLGAQVRVSYDLSQPVCTPRHGSSIGARSHRLRRLVESDTLGCSDGPRMERQASAARNPDVIDKFEAVFESYWSNGDFVPYSADQFQAEQLRGPNRHRPADHAESSRGATAPFSVAAP